MSNEFNDLPEDVAYDQINEAIKQFEKQEAGLPDWSKSEAPKYLEMSIEQLRKKTPDELSEAVLELNRYAFNIQRLLNQKKGWERWAKSKLDELTAHNIQNISDSFGYNERPMIAKFGSENCRKLNKFLRKIEMQIIRLQELPFYIRCIAENIRDIKFLSLKREKE